GRTFAVSSVWFPPPPVKEFSRSPAGFFAAGRGPRRKSRTGRRWRRQEQAVAPSAASRADQANQQMVDRLIAEGALWSPPLIAAFRATPRHCFLHRVFQYQRKHDRWREILTGDL